MLFWTPLIKPNCRLNNLGFWRNRSLEQQMGLTKLHPPRNMMQLLIIRTTYPARLVICFPLSRSMNLEQKHLNLRLKLLSLKIYMTRLWMRKIKFRQGGSIWMEGVVVISPLMMAMFLSITTTQRSLSRMHWTQHMREVRYLLAL